MSDLTERQREVLAAIQRRPLVYRCSVRELMPELGIGTPTGVNCHLIALERKGYIRRDDHRWGIEVIKQTEETSDGDRPVEATSGNVGAESIEHPRRPGGSGRAPDR